MQQRSPSIEASIDAGSVSVGSVPVGSVLVGSSIMHYFIPERKTLTLKSVGAHAVMDFRSGTWEDTPANARSRRLLLIENTSFKSITVGSKIMSAASRAG